MTVAIIEADLDLPQHAQETVSLLNAYALDIMGGGAPLSPFVQANLVRELQQRPSAHVILAYAAGLPAGLIICMEGFSTFACKPLLNIHDVMVLPQLQGLGIAKRMLAKAEDIARRRGCCKLTLEVLEGNAPAQSLYRASGFEGYALDAAMGRAMFWQKKLDL